jgi:hypothetical protein
VSRLAGAPLLGLVSGWRTPVKAWRPRVNPQDALTTPEPIIKESKIRVNATAGFMGKETLLSRRYNGVENSSIGNLPATLIKEGL